jgi:TP901 family phage tail tape measure protein
MADVIQTGAEFEQTLVSAAAKFPEGIKKGSEAFKQLEDTARKTGATTEFTASQAASGLNFLAMAGFNAEQSITALPAIVDLATAAQVDLATASDIATDSLGAFGLATKDATQLGKNLARVNDVMAKTATSANTTMELMMETIKEGGPVATSAGASLETFLALTGELANAGIKGSKAGTTLKNVFLKLSAPVGQASKLLKGMGVQTKDANGDLRDVVDILGDLDKGLAGLGTAEKSGVLNAIFGKIPIAGVNVLLKSGSEKLREYRKTLEGASGAAGQMASVMRDTLQGRINSMNSAIEGLKITLFSLKNDAIAGVVEGITGWVRVIDTALNSNKALATELIDGLMQAGKGLVGIFGLLLGKFIIMKTFLVSMAVLTQAWTATLAVLKVTMAAFSLLMSVGPIGAIALLITLGALLISNWETIVSVISSTIDFIAAPFKDLINGIMAITGAASGLFGGGDEEEKTAGGRTAAGPQVISPQERVAQTIEERRETSTAEVTIKDETGRAEMTGGKRLSGIDLVMLETGAF